MKKDSAAEFELTHRTLFGLLSRTLFGSSFSPEEGVEWEAVFQESKKQAVAVQVFMNLNELSGCENVLKEQIQDYVFKRMMRNIRVHNQHTYMHKLLSTHGIPYVTLKGAASARYYPDPQSRSMGDVDFYVGPDNFDVGLRVFQEAGFEACDLDHICHVLLKKKPMHMEMHHIPAGVPDGPVGERIRMYLSNLVEQAILVEDRSVTCYCPSDFHHGLIMLMHLQHHLLSEGVGLRHLCDWAVFVRQYADQEFPRLFAQKLRAVGLWKLARSLSLCASMYLGLPEHSWMMEEPEDLYVAASLMKDILAGGNFGSKDRQRAYEGLFISNRGKDGVRNNRMRRGVQALTRITYSKCPWIRRFPLLLPVGWALAIIGYLIRSISRWRRGERGRVLSAYHKSAPRISLYRELHIYEIEQ